MVSNQHLQPYVILNAIDPSSLEKPLTLKCCFTVPFPRVPSSAVLNTNNTSTENCYTNVLSSQLRLSRNISRFRGILCAILYSHHALDFDTSPMGVVLCTVMLEPSAVLRCEALIQGSPSHVHFWLSTLILDALLMFWMTWGTSGLRYVVLDSRLFWIHSQPSMITTPTCNVTSTLRQLRHAPSSVWPSNSTSTG